MLTLPLNYGLQVGLIKWTERPSTWIEGPTCSTYQNLLAGNTTIDFMHPWIKMSVKREAEMCQIQAGHLEKIRSVHEKVGAKRRKCQAGRPGRGLPAPLCGVLSSSSHGSYANRPSCVQPTPRPNTDL